MKNREYFSKRGRFSGGRLFLAGVCSAIAVVLSSCHKEGEYNAYYQLTGMTIQPANTVSGEPQPAGDTISGNLFALRLNLQISSDDDGFDPNEGYVSNTNPVSYIRIWSDRPYSLVPAYGNLNTQFMHYKGSWFHVDSISPFGDFAPTAMYYDGYSDHPFPEYTYLVARTPPEPGDYRFFVKLVLRDSTTFIDSTQTLHLLP